MELKRVKLESIKPYENNPRINDEAVVAVAESIRQCGYCAPIVVDEDMVILAGHTRHKALEKLGLEDVEVVVRAGLTADQKRKYRLLDNKTSEFAKWDFALLDQELLELDFGGFDFGFTNFSGLDYAGMDDGNLGDYKEPEKKHLRCPCCNHIDSAERFVKVEV